MLEGLRRLVRDAVNPDRRPEDPSRAQAPTVAASTANLPADGDPTSRASWIQIGRSSHWFVVNDPSTWIRRHVETIQIKSATFARRRLTIDVQLPDEIARAVARDGDEGFFWIPIASLTKNPPRSNIDLRDEDGAALPLLSREENASISRAAVAVASERLLKHAPSPWLRRALDQLITRDGIEADLALALAREALRREQGGATTPSGEAFDETLRLLAGNSWLWLMLKGRPGDLRVIKFHYDIELAPTKLWPRRARELRFLVRAAETGFLFPFEVPARGDGDPRSFPRRLAARVAAAVGWAAFDLAIDTPYITGSATYHLQVDSPPAVETRGVSLLAELADDEKPRSWSRHHGVHLYLTQARVDTMYPAVVSLRVGRRGFLTQSWLTALLIVALLWSFELSARSAALEPEASAALLLIIPALLTALVVRPGEHPVASRLLAGVRALVTANGLLAVAAAAAMVGVRPSAWTIHHAWFIYAVCASIVGGALTISWLLALDYTHRAGRTVRQRCESRRFYVSASWGAAILTAAVLSVGLIHPSLVVTVKGLFIGALAVLAAASGFVALTYARVSLPDSARVSSRGAGLVSCLAGFSALVLVAYLVRDTQWWGLWHWLTYASWALVGTLPVANYIATRRHATEGD